METRQITITDGAIRTALQNLGEGGKEVSYPLLYEALGLGGAGEGSSAKDVVRSRINDMTKHGEVIRTDRGRFVYNFKHKPRNAKLQEAIWRFVRAAKPDWTITDCSLMTHASYCYAMRYIGWLEQEGFVTRSGQNERRAITYRNTNKARQNPETPYPPAKMKDPFEKERLAAATIARHMLCSNPYAVKTAREIIEACHTLLARFEAAGNSTENENEREMEESHVE